MASSGFLRKLAPWILWDFPRGSWRYDVVVALILGFIFLTPRDFFRDRPKPQSVVMLPAEAGAAVFWIDAGALAGLEASQQRARAEAIVRSHSRGQVQRLMRLEPIFDSENELKGYLAFAVP